MCLIHIRPARDASPEPMVVPSRPITRGTPTTAAAPSLLPHSPRASRHSNVQARYPARASATSPRASSILGEPLKRLSIHSREQWEAQQQKQLERDREATAAQASTQDQRYTQHPPQSQPQAQVTTYPTAPEAPMRRTSQRETPALEQRTSPPCSPRTSANRIPTVRRDSYSYGSASVPTLPNGTTTTNTQYRIEAPISAPISPAAKDKENIPLAIMTPPTSNPHHRRRESGISIANSKDGSLVERPVQHHRSSSLSVAGGAGRRVSMSQGRPRRSAGNVSFQDGGGGGGVGEFGENPKSSQRSVRERVVIVEEGRRRTEYVRWEG